MKIIATKELLTLENGFSKNRLTEKIRSKKKIIMMNAKLLKLPIFLILSALCMEVNMNLALTTPSVPAIMAVILLSTLTKFVLLTTQFLNKERGVIIAPAFGRMPSLKH